MQEAKWGPNLFFSDIMHSSLCFSFQSPFSDPLLFAASLFPLNPGRLSQRCQRPSPVCMSVGLPARPARQRCENIWAHQGGGDRESKEGVKVRKREGVRGEGGVKGGLGGGAKVLDKRRLCVRVRSGWGDQGAEKDRGEDANEARTRKRSDAGAVSNKWKALIEIRGSS